MSAIIRVDDRDVKVSSADYGFLIRYRWKIHLGGHVCCQHRIMHQLIAARAGLIGKIGHINGDKLDNRRENLSCVITLQDGNDALVSFADYHFLVQFTWRQYSGVATAYIDGKYVSMSQLILDKSGHINGNKLDNRRENLFSYDDIKVKDLEGANLEGTYHRSANLRGANLKGANLRGAYLRVADLRGANLKGADLRVADLKGANLKGADLKGGDLKGANLRGVNLMCVNLRGANLRGANLKGADLRGADLIDVDLRNADLWGANLKGADLKRANLEGADLEGTILEGLKL